VPDPDNEMLAAFQQYGIDAMAHIPSLPDPGTKLKLPTSSNMKKATTEKIAQHLLSQDLEDLRKAKAQETACFFADLCDVVNLDYAEIYLE